MFDIKIINGMVIDGIGDTRYRADIGITGDQITAIGNLADAPALETVDARGQIVCPGFVDVHTHSDMCLMYDHLGSSKIYDGVTTEVIGNCGIGVAPVSDDKKEQLITYLNTRLIGSLPVKLELPWNTMDEYLTALQACSPATNVVPLVSHGAIRINEMGFARGRPTEEQLSRMRHEVKKAMQTGCFGLSSGLMYMPGEYSDVDELGALSAEVSPYDSFYVSHIRSEGESIMEALDEAIAIAKKGNTALHVSHLKLAGSTVWGKTDEVFEKIYRARAQGLDVTFDVYPYACGCTSLGTCMPPWTFEGGTAQMLERIKDRANRERIVREIKEGIHGWQNPIKTVGDWNRITLATCYTKEGEALLGRTIADICQETHQDPFEFIFDFLIQENGRVQILAAMIDQNDLDTIIAHPDAMIGSDGMNLSTVGVLSAGHPHPRTFGTHGHVLADYVRTRKIITLEDAVKKMTSKPAQRMRLERRGTLQEGNYADVTVFDPDTVQGKATYTEPKQYTQGISTVIVNGQFALRSGVQTGITSGRVLRKNNP